MGNVLFPNRKLGTGKCCQSQNRGEEKGGAKRIVMFFFMTTTLRLQENRQRRKTAKVLDAQHIKIDKMVTPLKAEEENEDDDEQDQGDGSSLNSPSATSPEAKNVKTHKW